jgi:quercetin dioxygenase-like cupin family protein
MRLASALVAALSLTATLAFAQGEPLTPTIVEPSEFIWTANPRGYEEVNIVGDPAKAGHYTAQVRFQPGLRIAPHFHPDDRIVTVLSGTVYFGYGDIFDETRMRALPPGSVWTEPAGQTHYAWAKDGPVVLEVVGHGPSGTTPIPTR